jgi:hypothetical protein
MKLPASMALPRLSAAEWLQLLRPGDAMVIGLGITCCVLAFVRFWSPAAVERAVIRQGGDVVAEFKLGPGTPSQLLPVNGPLGTTLIEIEGVRARVRSDPGPRQICVHQGWLTQANAVALCAPNQVSLQLLPRQPGYDSLHY